LAVIGTKSGSLSTSTSAASRRRFASRSFAIVRPTLPRTEVDRDLLARREGGRGAAGLARLRRAEEGGDDLVVHRAAHGVRAVLHVARLRVDEHPQLVRVVDQVVPVVIDGNTQRRSVGVSGREVGVARGALGRCHLADLVDRDGLLADV
jgi:hypothetical protein